MTPEQERGQADLLPLRVIQRMTLAVQGRMTVGVKAALATWTALNPAQGAKTRETPANATETSVISPMRAAPVQDEKATATLATQTAPDATQDKGTVGVVLEVSATAVWELAAPAKGAGAQAQGEMEEQRTTATAARMKIRKTKEAAAEYPLRGAVVHPMDETSKDINPEPSLARRGQLPDLYLQSNAENVGKVRQEWWMALL
jgi:hypothetical protein